MTKEALNKSDKKNHFSEKLKKFTSKVSDSMFNAVQLMDTWAEIDGHKFKEGKKYGIRQKIAGEIPAMYDEVKTILPRNEGAICKLDNKTFFVNYNNEKFSKEYDDMEYLYVTNRLSEKDNIVELAASQELTAIKLNDKWGIIDGEGDEIIEPKYDKIIVPIENSRNSLGVVIVKLNGKYGAVSSLSGAMVAEPEFESIKELYDNGFSGEKFVAKSDIDNKKDINIIRGKFTKK